MKPSRCDARLGGSPGSPSSAISGSSRWGSVFPRARAAILEHATPEADAEHISSLILRLRRASDPSGAGSIRVWARTAPHVRAALALQAAAEERGHAAEEILRARYRRLGERFLDGVTGGFAIALHDPGRGALLLARDGMGQESLAFAVSDEFVTIAWNEESLVGAEGVSGDLEPTRLAEFYANCELAGTSTFFSGVRLVAPGEMIVFHEGSVRKRELARPDPTLRLRLRSWEQYVERFAELLRRAVDRQICDVERVAVLLSGGLDSSPIAACANMELSTRAAALGAPESRVVALSWRLADAESDEKRFVTSVVDHRGLDLEWIDCDDAGTFTRLSSWPVHPATPEQTPYRWFHQRAYERAAARGCHVVLTGFSGDSLYGNALGWAWGLLHDRGFGETMDRLRECARETGWARVIRSQILAPLLPRRRTLRDAHAPYLTASARELLVARPLYPPDVGRARRPRQARRVLALLDSHGGQIERYYTSAFGVDARTPLRDFDLAQFLLASPAHLLEQGLEKRPVLRAAIRGWVPEDVRSRTDKATFFAIVERSLEQARTTWAPRLLRSREAVWRGFVEPAAIERWLTEPLDRGWDTSGLLHALYGELWRLERAGSSRAPFDEKS